MKSQLPPTTITLTSRHSKKSSGVVVRKAHDARSTYAHGRSINLRTPNVRSDVRDLISVSTTKTKKSAGRTFSSLLSLVLVGLMIINPVGVVYAAEEEIVELDPQESVEQPIEATQEPADLIVEDVYVAEEEGVEQENDNTPQEEGDDNAQSETQTDKADDQSTDTDAVSTDNTTADEVDVKDVADQGDAGESIEDDTATSSNDVVTIIDETEEDADLDQEHASSSSDDSIEHESATNSPSGGSADVATSSDDEIDTDEREETNENATSTVASSSVNAVSQGGSSSGGGSAADENTAEEETGDQNDQQNNQTETVEGVEDQGAENNEQNTPEENVDSGTSDEKDPVVDEATLRAEIAQVLEERLKKEYEAKLQQLLKDRAAEKVTISNFQSEQGFSDNECELLSNNEIYCRKGEVATEHTQSVFTGVFENEDSSDSEIILQIGGSVTQITDNNYDDINPVYDERMGTVVWQALIDGRWQIMVYDVDSAETTQVTGGGYNNINPHTFGNIIVWQGWANNNWDIFYAQQFENESGGVQWETVRVTENEWPDVEPHVAEGMILWESLVNGSWQVFSFDVYTSNLVQVSQGSGNNRNPRLMLLYESEEGSSTQLVGFDVATQKHEVINNGNTEPKPLSEEIPSSPMEENPAALPGSENTSSSSSRTSAKNESE